MLDTHGAASTKHRGEDENIRQVSNVIFPSDGRTLPKTQRVALVVLQLPADRLTSLAREGCHCLSLCWPLCHNVVSYFVSSLFSDSEASGILTMTREW